MARRLRAAMALLLFQALPEGLPASVEPAQVGAALGGPPGGVWGRAGLGGCVPGAAVGGARAWGGSGVSAGGWRPPGGLWAGGEAGLAGAGACLGLSVRGEEARLRFGKPPWLKRS